MKLGNLFKKEIRELLTPQALFSMLFTCVLLIILGQVMGTAMDEAINRSEVNILDLDKSAYTADMLAALPDYGFEPKLIESQGESYYDDMTRLGINTLVILPEGFGELAESGSGAVTAECVTLINEGGLTATLDTISASELTHMISSYVGDRYKSDILGLSDEQSELIRSPLLTVEYTAANGRVVKASPDMLVSLLMSQSLIAPMAVFFLIMMASQMIMTAISTEKIDKTLETLLSAPVSRLTVLTAKMLAALVVALLNSGFMIVGFVFYIQGMMGGAMSGTAADNASGEQILSSAQAMIELGFTLSPSDIIFFGIQLFLTVMIGLALSLVLGAMATDAKSVQTLVLPIMMITMIPFFVTMFTDVNSLPILPRVLMYVIPFTHTYTAMSNLMFSSYTLFYGGLLYQLIFFAACMYLAVKLFTTDLLFTMSFTPSKSKRAQAKGKKRTAD